MSSQPFTLREPNLSSYLNSSSLLGREDVVHNQFQSLKLGKMQHHNQIHKQRSKTILDHTIQKQDYSWSCKTFSSVLSTWTLFTSILNPVMAIYDRRERALRYEYRAHILSGLLASPSLLSSHSPPSSPSRLPCSHLASFPWFMWVEIVRVVGWSKCPTTRWNMLYRRISIIIKIRIHASLTPYSKKLSHHWKIKNKLTNKNRQQNKVKQKQNI